MQSRLTILYTHIRSSKLHRGSYDIEILKYEQKMWKESWELRSSKVYSYNLKDFSMTLTTRNQIRFHEEEDRQDLMLYRCRSIRHQQIYSAINMYTETQSLIFLAWFKICIQDWKAPSDFPISKYPCHWDPRKVIQEWWAINIAVPKEWLATAPTSENKTSNNFLFTNTPSCMKLAASKTPI